MRKQQHDYNNRFAPVDRLSEQEKLDANTRSFEGSGTSYLEVAGCLTVDRVRLVSTAGGVVEIPETEERQYPLDGSSANFEIAEEPMYRLEQRHDGKAVLIRSILSNDGVWQAGQSVLVTGTWNDKKAK